MPATDEPKGEGMTDQRPANDTLRSRVMSRIVAALTRLDERSDRVVDWLMRLDQRYQRYLSEIERVPRWDGEIDQEEES